MVFHLYGMIWCLRWGDEHDPQRAARIREHFRVFLRSYPDFFGGDGSMPMWGRSICYRAAAASPLPMAGLLNDSPLDPGRARRICSGTLLQFVGRDDVFTSGLPSLGFYRHFEPAIQDYSCAASPMWMYLLFLSALSLPEDAPFWSERENDGATQSGGVRVHALPGPGMTITADPTTGASTIITSKDESPGPNYLRLAYHSHLLWEDDDLTNGVTAMAYTLRDRSAGDNAPCIPTLRLDYAGVRDGVTYRQMVFGGQIWHSIVRIDLADLPVPCGILRLDRVRIHYPHTLTLGHFGLPRVNDDVKIEQLHRRGCPVITAHNNHWQLALVALHGWNEVSHLRHTGFHPETDESVVLFARRTCDQPYARPTLLATLLLAKPAGEPWREDELFPVELADHDNPTGPTLRMPTTGRTIITDFADMEGRAMR